MTKKIVPQAIKNLPSRLIPHVSEQDYIELQKGIRTRFDTLGNILSGIVKDDTKKKSKSAETQVEGSSDGSKPAANSKSGSPDKKKKLLPDAASTGLAFAAGALAVYFKSTIVDAAEGLYKAAKKMLGFNVEEDPEKNIGPAPVVDGSENEVKEIDGVLELIGARPDSTDNNIFRSGPNDDSVGQITDQIEDEQDSMIDDVTSNTETDSDDNAIPDAADAEKEIDDTMQNNLDGKAPKAPKAQGEGEGEGNVAAPPGDTPSDSSEATSAAPKQGEKSSAGPSTTAKDARSASRAAAAPPPAAATSSSADTPSQSAPPAPQPPAASSGAAEPAGGPVKDVPNTGGQGNPEQVNTDTTPTSTGTPSKSLLDSIKDFEGFSPKAKADYGQFSNGYGTKARAPDEEITKEEAELRLIDEVARVRGIVEKFSSTSSNEEYNKWNSNQIDALTSFIYNLGPGALNQVTNNGTRSNSEIAEAMLLYDNAGGSSIPELTKRREVESELFAKSSTDEPDAVAETPSPPASPPAAESSGGGSSGSNSVASPSTPTSPAASIAQDSEPTAEKTPQDVTVNTPSSDVNSSKTTGNQPKNDPKLSAGNPLARELAATHGKHTFGQTGTGTVAGI